MPADLGVALLIVALAAFLVWRAIQADAIADARSERMRAALVNSPEWPPPVDWESAIAPEPAPITKTAGGPPWSWAPYRPIPPGSWSERDEEPVISARRSPFKAPQAVAGG